MPTGNAGAAFMRNLPASDYVISDAAFDNQTEKNVVPMQPIPFQGLGAPVIPVRIPNNGLLSNLRFIFEGSLVIGASGTCTSGFQWPWNIIKKLTLNANGSTSLKSCEGLDLRMRRQRIYRNPREQVVSCVNTDTVGSVAQAGAVGDSRPGVIATGTYAITLEWKLPIVHNDETLTGLLFAQSDQNQLAFHLQPASASDLFTLAGGSTATLTGTFYPTYEFFDIPIDPGDGKGRVIVPSLAWLHGILTSDVYFSNTGEVSSPIIRTDGRLLVYSSYFANGSAAVIAPQTLAMIKWQYGGNRAPRTFKPVKHLLAKQQEDYNGLLSPGYMVLDNEVDNPIRDATYPKGISEFTFIADIPNGTSLDPQAHLHYCEETLFTGAAG